MRIFVDANVLVSGIVFLGKEHRLLVEASARGIQLITSEDVLDEVLTVLNKNFPAYGGLAEEFLKLVEIRVTLRGEYERGMKTGVVRDAADAHVLAAASESKCQIIATGDRDLLDLKQGDSTSLLTGGLVESRV